VIVDVPDRLVEFLGHFRSHPAGGDRAPAERELAPLGSQLADRLAGLADALLKAVSTGSEMGLKAGACPPAAAAGYT
jgi:hypothetical protein